MLFFVPRFVKQGRQFVKDARKLVAYKRDLAAPAAVDKVEGEIANLESMLRLRDRPAVEAQMQRLDQACGTLTEPHPDAAWRENVEVFLVAIVIALAVRTYFLQPFTIPTGSMQPTLNGIISFPQAEPGPNPLVQIAQFAALGRTYVNVVAKADERVESVTEAEDSGVHRFLTWTRIDTSANHTYWVWANKKAVLDLMGEKAGYKAGEPIARGYINTGDHVFVDKLTYHFRAPQRGEVFVFSTHGIGAMSARGELTQYYIKRLAGVPGDQLCVNPPELRVNGELAKGYGFERVMSGTRLAPKNGYRGYGNGAEYRGMVSPMNYLTSPDSTFQVPQHAYFAMGDNSFNSSDSRNWGTVPEENVMGRAILVYWPFNTHWSLIR